MERNNMSTKQWIPVIAVVIALLDLTPVYSHGVAKPMHGGIVQVVNDLSFELVIEMDGVTIYLLDHGKPMAVKGITGKLTVLQGGNKMDVDLKEGGDNKLRALGVKLGKGDKVVATLSNVAGKTTTVRFVAK